MPTARPQAGPPLDRPSVRPSVRPVTLEPSFWPAVLSSPQRRSPNPAVLDFGDQHVFNLMKRTLTNATISQPTSYRADMFTAVSGGARGLRTKDAALKEHKFKLSFLEKRVRHTAQEPWRARGGSCPAPDLRPARPSPAPPSSSESSALSFSLPSGVDEVAECPACDGR